MRITRHQFFQVVAGGSAWLASSGFMQRIKFAAPPVAKPLPLNVVRLIGGPLKNAQDLDAKYLLSLDPDRMLSFYRVRAGLEPKAPGLTGWDADGRKLTGPRRRQAEDHGAIPGDQRRRGRAGVRGTDDPAVA